MKILFHANTLNYRGTTVALTDYATYNQSILGNESILIYNSSIGYAKDMGTELTVVDSLKKKFPVLDYGNMSEFEKIIEKEKIDAAYIINGGAREPVPSNCRTLVHAVFQFYQPNGDRYAYISKWLSDKMSNGKIPYIPHIVDLPNPTKSLREELGISNDKTIVGRIGGYYTFDIPGIKEYVINLVNSTDKFVFLFVGTEPFVQHRNVMFLNEIHDPLEKANYINSCDCMLHARQRGESFGLAIAEFLSLNKPVLAWAHGHDLNHTVMLKDSETLYQNGADITRILNNIKDIKQDWTRRVSEFKPEQVMNKFNEVFLT